MRRRPRLIAAAALLVGLLGSCGQYDGRHRSLVGGDGASTTRVSFEDGTSLGLRLSFDSSMISNASRSGPGVLLQGDGPLVTCPVRGRGYYLSNFGAFRLGPPIHRHQGNDVFAPYGTPIVAPFDGFAVADPNVLGGKAVKVYGDRGYVYNAHLSRYGRLGPVEVGGVIGFVGNSGNARASLPHDHFEWHPRNGPAVDPFPFLNEACPRTG